MKAMILAAGRGERMRPLTDRTPKPLLEAGGKPLIVHQIERLQRAGFRELLINHAYLGHQIEARLGDGSRWGVRIRYSPEDPPLETGGGIVQALPMLGPGPFLVTNGDVWMDYPLHRLRLPAGSLAHLVLVDNPPHHPVGDFSLEAGLARPKPGYTFSGLGLYHPDLFCGCRPDPFPLGALLRQAMRRDQVSAERYSGDWWDIGTPERLAQLDARLGRAG